MRLLQCLLKENDCWKKYKNVTFEPEGIVVHATDPAGEVISRFVQPFAGQTDGMEIDGKPATAEQLIAALGKNKYGNHWNRSMPDDPKAVHAFVGKLASGSYAACQTLRWTMPCWGAGSGPKGSYNGCQNGKARKPLYIQIEMIEGAVGNAAHATQLYVNTVELCAWLCLRYPTIKLENIVSHREAHARGYATDHGDPEGYWRRSGVGFTMAQFRADVQQMMEDYIDMTKEEVQALIEQKVGAAVSAAAAQITETLRQQLADGLSQIERGVGSTLDAYLGRYVERIGDVPHKSVAVEVRTLLDCEAINGGTGYETDPDDIRLPYNILRALVMAKRYTEQLTGKTGEG